MRAVPALFVSHGAPTFAIEPGEAGRRLAALADGIGRPEAILVVSAHWETDRPAVSTAVQPDTIHDFRGFPEALYRLRYPAPGAPALARRVQALLGAAGVDADLDPHRGLDHGAWVPLMHLYPDATVPVTQLSIQTHLGPEHHWRIGRAIAALRREGVLVIGSGSVTHNLGEFRMLPENAGEAPYVQAFRDWLAARIEAADAAALLDYRRLAPHAARAHPTEDHLLPLFTALGAAGDGGPSARVHGGVTFGVIGMDTYLLGASASAGKAAA